MAKIELLEVKRLASRGAEINTEINNQLTQLTSTLEEICANVQSSSLNQANQNLLDAIRNINTIIGKNFPQIVSFLDSQISEYDKINVEAETEINNLTNSINELYGLEGN